MSNRKHTGIELLRIIAMLWIIAFHYADHGAVNMLNETVTISWIILALCRIGGGIGNSIFVLITGYFMWNKHFKLQRLVKLWAEVWLYSVICGILYFGLEKEQLPLKELIKILMPITFREYWYMSTYVVFYFFIPYINKVIDNLDKKQHKFTIILILFFFSMIPTMANIKWMLDSGNLFIFGGLYLVGAFISKYKIMDLVNKKKIFLGILAGIIGIVVSEIILKIIGLDPFYFSWEMYKAPVIVVSVLLFLLFTNLQINLPWAILLAAKSVYGVYLFHIGRLNKVIFLEIFNNNIVYQNSFILVLHIITSILLIFIVGVFVYQIISKILEVTVLRLISNIINKGDNYINQFY